MGSRRQDIVIVTRATAPDKSMQELFFSSFAKTFLRIILAFFHSNKKLLSPSITSSKMGTKRKPTSSRPKDEAARPVEKTKYQINEKFADSEDDFFAGRDQILLDNGSSNKRQKLQRDGGLSQGFAAHTIAS